MVEALRGRLTFSYCIATLLRNRAWRAHPVCCVAHWLSKVLAHLRIASIEGASNSFLKYFGSESNNWAVVSVKSRGRPELSGR